MGSEMCIRDSTALIRTPRASSSLERVFDRLSKAALVAEYTEAFVEPTCALIEVFSTTEAGLANTGNSDYNRKNGPLTLIAKERSNVSSVHCSTGCQTEMPALRNTASTWP